MVKVEVAPELLEWACRQGDLDDQTLLSVFPKLSEWKAGTAQPTLKQLEKFAHKNHVPLGMLFLPSPPREQIPIPDFRTIQASRVTTPSRELLETIYLCQQQQDWYAQYLRNNGFVNSVFFEVVNLDSNVIEVANAIRETIGFTLEARQDITTWKETLRFFVDQVSKLNILVMLNGVVGNNTHRPLDVNEFRGFALPDPIAPLIFINSRDAKAAQIFTLAHELAHIWLGKGGVSNTQAVDVNGDQEPTELWCNSVAAELLVPLKHLKTQFNSEQSFSNELQRLARYYKVSTLVVLRRLYNLNVYDYQRFRQLYSKELNSIKQQMADRQSSGGNFRRTLEVRVNKYFLRAIVSSALEGETLFRDAFKLLGIKKADTFFNLASQLRES